MTGKRQICKIVGADYDILHYDNNLESALLCRLQRNVVSYHIDIRTKDVENRRVFPTRTRILVCHLGGGWLPLIRAIFPCLTHSLTDPPRLFSRFFLIARFTQPFSLHNEDYVSGIVICLKSWISELNTSHID